MLRAFDGGQIATKGGAAAREAEREKECVFFIRITLLSLLGISWLSSTQDGVKAQTCACRRHFGFSVLNDQLLIVSPQMYNNDGGTPDPNDEIPTYKKKNLQTFYFGIIKSLQKCCSILLCAWAEKAAGM